VRLIPKKAARLIGKTLASAIANAENNNDLRASNLVVLQPSPAKAPRSAHAHPRPCGGARINKRTAHIKIILTEAAPVAEKPAKAKGIKKTKAAKAKVATTEETKS